ncbi:hypothetical protein FSARC_13751 [Fusarium sarcochroum]|uniref:DUF1275 domain protein n=1 Tax=Fusarium sarcochroum TaxID=1208366 RepID=A0A8H4WSJ4_9HYPO|nr:hypothetical protein FSARC_13751 [Fusarium sarcochroum]
MPELTEPQPNKLSARNFRHYSTANLKIDFLLETQLIILTFCIGIQDAISYPDFQCFASNQTGNSVVLAIGVAGDHSNLFSPSNVGLSLGMFISGALITGQLANVVGPRGRAWLIVSHAVQTLMTFTAAAIHSLPGSKGTGPLAMASLALLAFASGAQVASMRPFRIQEITTAMATAAWVDFVIDPNLLGLKNRPRDRRAAFLVALVAGSFAGAFMRSGIGSSNALIVSAAGKMLVTTTFLFNREETSVAES